MGVIWIIKKYFAIVSKISTRTIYIIRKNLLIKKWAKYLNILKWVIGVSRCKLLYTEWINSKVLLCSTESYIQCATISHNRKEHIKEERTYTHVKLNQGFPDRSVVENLPASTGDTGSVSESGRSPAGGNDNPLQHSCLENPTGRGAWWLQSMGLKKSWTQLSN